MAITNLKTRTSFKNDTSSNWENSTLVLLKAEIAIEITDSQELKFKIGNGVDVFKDLEYNTMTPAEISTMIIDSIKVTGTKGGAESVYRTGNINITKENIGLENADNTADSSKNVLSATKLSSAREISLTGDVTGTVSTNLSGDVIINTTVSNDSHTHGNSSITTLDASKVTTGIFDLERIPKAAIPDIKHVADDAVRFSMTIADIQKGDTVKVTSTGIMFYVKDDTKLSSEDGYEAYNADVASSVPWTGVTGRPSTFTPSAHNHTKSQITDFPGALPNPNALTISLNGSAQTPYTGSNAVGLNITPEEIGAATSNHGTHVLFSGDAPKAAGTATAGTATTVSRGDHIHPLQSSITGSSGSCTGNSKSATTLATSRNFSISGGVTASSVGFNGSGDVTLNVSAVSTDCLVEGTNTLIFDCGNATL